MKLKKFDVVDFLDNDESLVEYLNAALAENDPNCFAKALGNVARAKGMSSISECQWGRAAISLQGTLGRRQPPDRYTVQSLGSPEHPACHRGEQLTASFSSLSVDRKKVLAVLAAGTFFIPDKSRPPIHRLLPGRIRLAEQDGPRIADVSIRREPPAGVCLLGLNVDQI